MLRQIKTLAKLELRNLFGLNVLRYTKDPKARRRAVLLWAAWVLVIGIVALYVGGLSFGLILLGAEDVIPAYLIAISSIIIFFFGIFKAGSVIFCKNGYDILCSLPVSQTAVVVSRFLRMYAQDLALTLAVLLPGLAVYAWFLGPDVSFYAVSVIGLLIVPLAPIAAATLIGAAVTAISSRMKHKSLVEAGLSILIVLAVFAGSSRLTGMEGETTPEMLKEFSATVLSLLGKLYPPAVWLGTAIVRGDFLRCFACAGLSLAVFAGVAAAVSANYRSICRRLYSTAAKHDYRMGSLKKDSVLRSLYKRELKRYFASGIYVSNTIMGPVLGTVLSGTVFFVGLDRITQAMPVPVDIGGLIPFGVAAVFCMMPPSSVSVSMEGSSFWIMKSLPLSTKSILDAKILLSLSLMMPFWLVSEALLILALKPGIWELLWLLVIPAVIILFTCVYGITVNLHFPVLNWENEVSVVKQSAAALIGGLGGSILAILCAVLVALVPGFYGNLAKLAVCGVLLGITALLYRKNNRSNLQEI